MLTRRRTKGATLHLKFVLPEAVLSKIKTTSISASVNGTGLAPETYTQAGEFDVGAVGVVLQRGEQLDVNFVKLNCHITK